MRFDDGWRKQVCGRQYRRPGRRGRLFLVVLLLAAADAAGEPRPRSETPREGTRTTTTRTTAIRFNFSWQGFRRLFQRGGGDGMQTFAASLPDTTSLALRPDLLPPGVSVSYPAFDGDAFLAVLPPRALAGGLPASQVLAEIEPLLRAVGFERGTAGLGVPRDAGTRLPPADLARLAQGICPELHAPPSDPAAAELRRGDEASFDLCAAMLGGPVSRRAEGALQNAYGLPFARFRAELEQPIYEYVFPQLVDGVPIESAGVLASRREAESVSLVHGTLLERYVLANRPRLAPARVWPAVRGLLELSGRGAPESENAGGFDLVLLPDGAGQGADGVLVPALRYAYRGLVRIHEKEGEAGLSWMVWVDADKPAILSLLPQQDFASAGVPPPVEAVGTRWRRDPTTGTQRVLFRVTPGSPLVLGRAGVFHRLDRGGDGDPANDLSLSGAADFTAAQGAPEQALCGHQGNAAYRQVHAYSHLHGLWNLAVGAGTLPEFPASPLTAFVDYADPEALASGSAALYDGLGFERSVLAYDAGSGFLSPQCPGVTDARMNGAQDATTLAHEMAHLVVKRLLGRRPWDWCREPRCPIPGAIVGYLFHDFADAVAAAYASTPCLAGWTGKNAGGVDASLHCRQHDEGSRLPRHIDAAVDRFPEHRVHDRGGYADGQIAAAALWSARQGLRSRSTAGGTAELWIRLNRALWRFAFLQPTCSRCEGKRNYVDCSSVCDRDIYRYLQTLMRHMVADQVSVAAGRGWAHTVNKVVAGWARAGIFLVPPACLVAGAAAPPVLCPPGARGADAVIDVDDREPGDDPQSDGVIHPEGDYLRRKGPPPAFEVWTGPRFGFDARGKTTQTPAPPCNPFFVVEVANDPSFVTDTKKMGKRQVFDNRQGGSPARADGCRGTWTMSDAVWKALQGTAGETRIYYRVKTYDAGRHERISTRPGGGSLGEVPPPFVVVNATGRP